MKRLASLADADVDVLDCRDMGHAWRRSSDGNLVLGTRREVVEFEREDECGRCGAIRVRVMEVPSMGIKRVRIKYPDDYLAPEGHRFARADARREQYERVMRLRDEAAVIAIRRAG